MVPVLGVDPLFQPSSLHQWRGSMIESVLAAPVYRIISLQQKSALDATLNVAGGILHLTANSCDRSSALSGSRLLPPHAEELFEPPSNNGTNASACLRKTKALKIGLSSCILSRQRAICCEYSMCSTPQRPPSDKRMVARAVCIERVQEGCPGTHLRLHSLEAGRIGRTA